MAAPSTASPSRPQSHHAAGVLLVVAAGAMASFVLLLRGGLVDSQLGDAPVSDRRARPVDLAAAQPAASLPSLSSAASLSHSPAALAPSQSGPGRPPSPTGGASGAPAPRKCGLDPHPWLEGSFDNSTAPFWTPSAAQGCFIRAFDDAAAARCFGNRTIYVMGNSVARGLFYELPAMMPVPDDGVGAGEFVLLGLDWVTRGQAPPRMWQKEECKKVQGEAGEAFSGASCATTIEPIHAAGRFQWRQWFWQPSPDLERNEAVADICTGMEPADCTAVFFANATARDYLVFNMGLVYAQMRTRLQALGLWFDRPKHEGGRWPWLEAGIANFTAALARLPIPATQMVFVNSHRLVGDEGINALSQHVNDFAVPLLLDAGIACIDQRTINAGREQYFADQIHYPGVLSRAFWHAAETQWCA